MALRIVKETIELDSIQLDGDGNCWIQKRINLQEGVRHTLRQVDVFEDAIPFLRGAPTDEQPLFEIVISPYPQIPTNMLYCENIPQKTNRYASAGDDSVLFKAQGRVIPLLHSQFKQFPSVQIAAQNKSYFYSNHVYINIHFMGIADLAYGNIALSFMMAFENKNVSYMEASLGILAESHSAMCAQLMTNGSMVTLNELKGNVFPMWRFGGIRPEHTLSPLASNAFFLPISTRDSESMMSTPDIRTAVAEARQMSAYDDAFGLLKPDWLADNLNAGIIAGQIRDQWPPILHATSGNVLMI